MTAKAQYTPNCYVCNKCGSRMDAIITPPLSILGKIKLVCNNCNKHMTKTWQEEYDNIFGEKHYKICLGKNCECHKEVKQFISDLIDQTREETIREVEEMLPEEILDDYCEYYSTEYKNGFNDCLEQSLKSLINK